MSAIETMRNFFETRQRERLLVSSTSDDPVLDAPVERIVALIKKVEDDEMVAVAIVNIMKAFYLRGDVVKIIRVALDLLTDSEMQLELAQILGYENVDEMKKVDEDNRPNNKRKRTSGGGNNTWSVEGDPMLGEFFVMDKRLARVDAWMRKESGKQFRATLLIGEARGHLVEVTEESLEEMGHSSIIDEELAKIPDHATLDGADVSPVAEAVRRLELAAKISPEWARSYGLLVLAASKQSEPLWPAIVLDPRNLDDIKLRDRAERLLNHKHIVKFLGLPDSSSLGFVAKENIKPYVGANGDEDDRDDENEVDKDHHQQPPQLSSAPPLLISSSSAEAQASSSEAKEEKKVSLSSRTAKAYQKAIVEARDLVEQKRVRLKPPPLPGSKIIVTYLDDDTIYRCTVLTDPEIPSGLLVHSPDFGPDEPSTIAFDPDEDDWEYIADEN